MIVNVCMCSDPRRNSKKFGSFLSGPPKNRGPGWKCPLRVGPESTICSNIGYLALNCQYIVICKDQESLQATLYYFTPYNAHFLSRVSC